MPKTHLYTWQPGRDFISTKKPLESVQPAIGEDEPRDEYHKPWGYYPFIYESVESLAIGGLAGFIFMPGSPGLGLGPWTIPNLDLAGAEDEGAPGALTTKPAGDLITQLCTADNMKNNKFMQELCMNLAHTDGCRELKDVLPNLTGFKTSNGGTDFVNIFDVPLPNGFTLSVEHATVHFSGILRGCDNDAVRVIIKNPKDGSATDCTVCYLEGPNFFNQCFCLTKTFAEALAAALACVDSNYSTPIGSKNYKNLGCK